MLLLSNATLRNLGKKSRYMTLSWSLSDALPDADMDGNVLAMIEHLLVQRSVNLYLAYNNNAISTTAQPTE